MEAGAAAMAAEAMAAAETVEEATEEVKAAGMVRW